MITQNIGQLLFSSVLTLLAIHYTYELAYNPLAQNVLQFFQEKLLGDRLPSSKKINAAYSNIFRAVDCIQLKINEQKNEGTPDKDYSAM